MKTNQSFGSTCSWGYSQPVSNFNQSFASSHHFGTSSFYVDGGALHGEGLDIRALSQRIRDLKLAGRSIEEIAKIIDPKDFERMVWR